MLATLLLKGQVDYQLSGRIAMSAMLLFTAVGHFAFAEGMTLMIPGSIPFKKQLVYFTGVIEIAASICLLIPALQVSTAWFLIVFFIILLPANIYAAIKHIDYQKATYDGPGMSYLWFRIPLQILFIVWVYWFALR
jgi:uncharacterized membrane protein